MEKRAGSRKSRLRHNAEEGGGPNLLLIGGALVGGYLAWCWFRGRAKPAMRTATAVPSSRPSTLVTADAAWSIFDARPTKAQSPQISRPDFDRLWGSLTPGEKDLFLQMSVMTQADSDAFSRRKFEESPMDPTFSSLIGKLMAAAPPGMPPGPPPSEATAPKGTSGIGNYYNEP